MASSSEMVDRLGKASLAVKAIILVAVLAVFAGIYYYLVYSDLSTDYDNASQNKNRLVEDERRLLKRKSDYQELLRQKADVEDRLKKNSIKLPESSEVPAFFQHLETQAATANVRIVSRSLDKEIPVEGYIKVPVKMEIAGDFYQLNQYFKLLSDTARIITIENLNIGSAQRVGDHLELTAKFTASTFRQADKPVNVAPPPAGPTDAPPPAPTGPSKPPENPAGAPPSAPAVAPVKPAAPAPAPAAPAKAPAKEEIQ